MSKLFAWLPWRFTLRHASCRLWRPVMSGFNLKMGNEFVCHIVERVSPILATHSHFDIEANRGLFGEINLLFKNLNAGVYALSFSLGQTPMIFIYINTQSHMNKACIFSSKHQTQIAPLIHQSSSVSIKFHLLCHTARHLHIPSPSPLPIYPPF